MYPIILLRLHPNGKKMFAVKGKIVLSVNMDKKDVIPDFIGV